MKLLIRKLHLILPIVFVAYVGMGSALASFCQDCPSWLFSAFLPVLLLMGPLRTLLIPLGLYKGDPFGFPTISGFITGMTFYTILLYVIGRLLQGIVGKSKK